MTFSTHPEWDAPDLDPPPTTPTESEWKVWLLVPMAALLAFVVTVLVNGAVLR